MARSGSCPACSAKLAKHAAYCSSCGQALGVDVDLSELDSVLEGDDELGGAELDGTEPGPAPRLARTRNLLVGVGLAVALIGGAIIVSRDDAETTAATDATTTSSSDPRRSPRTTRVTLPRPTTSVYLELVPKGSLLPAPTNTVLYGTTSDGQLARIVLDTGEISVRRLPEGTADDAVMQLIPRAGSIVVVGFPGTSSYVVPRDLKGEIVELELENEQVFRGPGPDELWRVSSTFSTPSVPLPQVQLIKTDGTAAGPVQQLALQVYLEDGAGRLIGRGPGGYYVFAPEDGRPSLLSEGEMVSVDAQRIVDLVCDDALTCRWRVRDRAGGEPRLLEMPPNPGELYLGGGGVASPDGRWVGFDDGEGRLQLLDLESGAISRFGSTGGYYYGGVAWSADSSWMFWSENGSLRAWQVGAAEPVRIGGGSTPSLNTLVAVPAAEG